MEQAIRAIGDAEKALQATSKADSAVFRHIIEVLTMQNKREEWNKQYDGLVQGKIERLKALSPDARAELRARFAKVIWLRSFSKWSLRLTSMANGQPVRRCRSRHSEANPCGNSWAKPWLSAGNCNG